MFDVIEREHIFTDHERSFLEKLIASNRITGNTQPVEMSKILRRTNE